MTGDRLMGPDSRPREVISTNIGHGPMFRINPVKGDSWVCNDVHVMTLTGTNRHMGEVIDIPLNELIERTEKRGVRIDRDWKLWRASVDFPSREVPVDPYLVGLWIGDGAEGEARITNGEPEVRDFCRSIAASYGVEFVESRDEQNNTWDLRFRVGERGEAHRGTPNPLRRFFRERCSLSGGGKVIPDEYLRNDERVRLALLAGILDTDGYTEDGSGYEVTTVSEVLRDQILYLARSLGFGAYSSQKTSTIRSIGFRGIYQRITLSGDIDRIPLRVGRRQGVPRRQIKRVGCTGFEAIPIGDGDYYGFTLDGDGRFLLGDFTVTHNTTTIMHALTLIPRNKRVLVVAFNKTIQKELAAKLPPELTNVTVTTLAAHGYSVLRHYWPGVELLTRKGEGGDVCDKARDATVFYAALGADEQGLKGQWIQSSKDWKRYYSLLDDIRELITLCECFLAMTPEAIRAVQVDYDKLTHEGSPLQWDWQGRTRLYGPDDVVRWVLAAQRERLREPPANSGYGRYAVTREKYLSRFLPIYNELTEDGRRPFCSFRDMTFVPAATPSMVPPERYDWIFVDETQDMDVAQTELVIRTLSPTGRVVVVGDTEQAIYRFRGADSGGMTRLKHRLGATELPLSVSYRVPECVAREARTVVKDFSVPERMLDGSPWPEGTCAKITAAQMANRWRAGDLVISRLNAPLVPMAMLAISQGITPLILGEGNGVAFKVRGLFNRILEARGLTHAAPLDAFQPALLAWRESEINKITQELREKLRGWEATYEKEKRDFDAGRSRRRPSRFWDRTGSRFYDSNAALDQLLGESTDAAEARLIFSAFWNPQGTGLSQRDGLATVGDIASVVARLAPTEKAMESLTPEEYKALMASRLVLTSVHRIKGGEAPRVFLLTETFRFAFGRWQKRAPDNPKDQKEEQNLWYVAVTRAKAEMGNPDSGILWYVSDVESYLGRSREWKVDQG